LLKEGDKALRTSGRYYCLDCEKTMFIDTEDVSDAELERFFSNDGEP
jgi:hypothetical protein